MFWAAFRDNTRAGLVPVHRDPDSARGDVTSHVIRELYQALLLEFIQPVDTVYSCLTDGAPVHRAHIVKAILDKMQI